MSACVNTLFNLNSLCLNSLGALESVKSTLQTSIIVCKIRHGIC